MNRSIFILLVFMIGALTASAQHTYWQQHVSYRMEIEMDAAKHQFTGKQRLTYTNNSPDTLHKVFYHLYFNAFRPGSMMDMRSRSIADPDPRVGDRIAHLSEDEQGYQHIKSLSQDGAALEYHVQGTVLEVNLAKPMLPGDSSVFYMEFDAQVPVQIRRSGRDNKQGVDYSMTQWYPKMAEYDFEGWHADPYVGREFFGVWGDFDVSITIDARYTLGGTGYLQSPNEIGHGYEEQGTEAKQSLRDKLTWHFIAPRVHDFAWAADTDFIHQQRQVPGGPVLHFLYLPDSTGNWVKLQDKFVRAFQLMNENFGKYPYKQFSVIQGGDGGMEYPMATLIAPGPTFGSILSVTVHESLHNWYYGVLASNETEHAWMDEGFTSYAQDFILNALREDPSQNPHVADVKQMIDLYSNGLQEPSSTPSDHFRTNYAYGVSSYSKGAVFLMQLEYIMGKTAFWKGMKRYFSEWGFKHPSPNDFVRVMEKTSGLQLHWFSDLWIKTTQTIDYGIGNVNRKKGGTEIVLTRTGELPMPLDIKVTLKNGDESRFYIPLALMRGEKPVGNGHTRTQLPDWEWTNTNYSFELDIKKRNISRIEIDPTQRLADFNRDDNIYPVQKEKR